MSKGLLPILGLIALALLTVHLNAKNDCVGS